MIRQLLMAILAMVFLGSIAAHAEEMRPVAHQAQPIPYKSGDTPLQEHGSRIGWVVIGFLLLAWGVAYYLRKKGTLGSRNLFNRQDPQLQVLDRHRLDARTTLYVIEFDQKKLLIGHAGDNITTLAESSAVQNQAGQNA